MGNPEVDQSIAQQELAGKAPEVIESKHEQPTAESGKETEPNIEQMQAQIAELRRRENVANKICDEISKETELLRAEITKLRENAALRMPGGYGTLDKLGTTNDSIKTKRYDLQKALDEHDDARKAAQGFKQQIDALDSELKKLGLAA